MTGVQTCALPILSELRKKFIKLDPKIESASQFLYHLEHNINEIPKCCKNSMIYKPKHQKYSGCSVSCQKKIGAEKLSKLGLNRSEETKKNIKKSLAKVDFSSIRKTDYETKAMAKYPTLLEDTEFLNIVEPTLRQRIWHMENAVFEIVKCPTCKTNNAKYSEKHRVYRNCSVECLEKHHMNRRKNNKPVYKKKFKTSNYLTEEKLGEFLKILYPDLEFIHDKIMPNSGILNRPDYRNDELKLIVEYDGDKHYKDTKSIKNDLIKNKMYRDTLGYKIIRIPYFVQLSKESIKHYFDKEIDIEQIYPHGFISKNCILPADFSEWGTGIFINTFNSLPDNIKTEIKNSIYDKIQELGDHRLVVNNRQIELLNIEMASN